MNTAVEPRGELTVTIGGADFVLVPTFTRIAQVEAALGKSLMQVMMDIAENRGVRFMDVATIIHTLSRDSSRSVSDVGQLIAKEGLARAISTLTPFLNNVMMGGGGSGNASAGSGQPANE